MSATELPRGYKITIDDQPDSYHLTGWTLYAVIHEWKTTERKRFLRKPVAFTGWHELGRRRVGSNFVDQRAVDAFTSDWIESISLLNEVGR